MAKNTKITQQLGALYRPFTAPSKKIPEYTPVHKKLLITEIYCNFYVKK